MGREKNGPVWPGAINSQTESRLLCLSRFVMFQ